MKKFILPLLILLFVGSLFAVESAPSEVVGYFRKEIPAGGWSTLALPFGYASLDVNDVLGLQFGEEDVLLDINGGFSTSFYDGYGWDGELMELGYGVGYYINRVDANGPLTYYVLGKVDAQPFTVTMNGGGIFTAFGIADASAIPVMAEDHPFGANPFDGDVLLEIDSGLSTTFYDGYGWDGELFELSPATAYFYASNTGFVWNYVPVSRRDNTQSITSPRIGTKK